MKRKSTAIRTATATSTTTGVSHSPASILAHPEIGASDIMAGFEAFAQAAQAMLQGRATAKGYTLNGDGRSLLDFVAAHNLTHAEAEMVYKILRWHNRHNAEDLHKVAAWAFLELDRHQRKGTLA